MQRLIVLELNELNFEMMKEYSARGVMPNFANFLARHGYAETTAEVNHIELEPWIQWVTVHTGKAFADHQVFRLGDIEGVQHRQIWEQLEALGLRVGAVCPMNAVNRLTDAAFFLPDPWTKTRPDGPFLARSLSPALSQAINDNSDGRIMASSLVRLLGGVIAYARPANYLRYLRLAAGSLRRPWNKVLFLDLFLSDLFIKLNKSRSTNFSTVFFNGGAHLQHHYMYSTKSYQGSQRNPAWYIGPDCDPVGDIYRLYDKIIGDVIANFPDRRIMLITGLHQDATSAPKFYWRLSDHAGVLRRLNLKFSRVEPRMSRDFLVHFASAEDKQRAIDVLRGASLNGERVFEVDERDGRDDIFVELVYPGDIPSGTRLVAGGCEIADFRSEVNFVALKNGQHNGIGYFADSGRVQAAMPATLPLTQLYSEILGAFSLAAE